jgi:hypothetical protein
MSICLNCCGRLRQGVKGARLAAVGNEEFARAFGGGFEKNRRLDFEEALFVHEDAVAVATLLRRRRLRAISGRRKSR